MSDGLLVDHDPLTGKVVRFHDLGEDRYALNTTFDVEPLLDQNKALSNASPTGWKGWKHWVASIPMPIYSALLKTWREQKLSKEERQAALHRWLNDRDNTAFRVKAGRL